MQGNDYDEEDSNTPSDDGQGRDANRRLSFRAFTTPTAAGAATNFPPTQPQGPPGNTGDNVVATMHQDLHALAAHVQTQNNATEYAIAGINDKLNMILAMATTMQQPKAAEPPQGAITNEQTTTNSKI